MNVARSAPSGMALVGSLVLGLLVTACASMGPGRVPADRFNYNESIAQSSKSQMLLNLVRMRYRDTPVFLAVTSVLTQYIYAGNANIIGTLGTSLGESQNSLTGAVGLRYLERPTITYSPLTGKDFANQLLRPISSDLIFSLVASGWPPDWLFMMSLERLNDLRNLPFDSAPSPQVREQLRTFHRAVRLMIDLGERSAIEVREANHAEPDHAGDSYLVIEDSVDPETQVLVHDLKQLLGLDPERSEFRITDRITQRKSDEITIRIRSLITLMGFLSRGIEIPEAHAQEGRALPTATLPEADDPSLHSLMKVSSSLEQPVEAFVAVRYQNYWFYIPHSDQQSKQAFTLLTYLFQMQALPEAPSAAPVITVSAG